MKRLILAAGLLLASASGAWAKDELVGVTRASGERFNYVLTSHDAAQVRYGVILMPGGRGILDPHMEGSKIAMSLAGNFLIRSRELFAGGAFVAASTDATTSPDRILAIAADLQKRYGAIAIYVIGTSRSTDSTMALSRPLDGQVAGFVHTSSMNGIATLDPRGLKSRHLLVLHKNDACRVTQPANAVASHNRYGTELIEVEGGKSVGDDCEARAYHGYNGIERETVDKIKAWIQAGK
ncbi:MAG: hypothetical protein JSR47_12785 [Proteobacteria bacterium]|nr:hypothetical protein [Pseudomonadota bacterium]